MPLFYTPFALRGLFHRHIFYTLFAPPGLRKIICPFSTHFSPVRGLLHFIDTFSTYLCLVVAYSISITQIRSCELRNPEFRRVCSILPLRGNQFGYVLQLSVHPRLILR